MAIAAVPGALAVGMVLAEEPRPVAVVPVVSPVTVTVPPALAPTVIVNPAPAPAAPVAAPAPPLQMLAPAVDAACVLADPFLPHCRWADGFPAISGDGRLIAEYAVINDDDPSSSGTASKGALIKLVDSRASGGMPMRVVTLLGLGERDRAKDPHALGARLRQRVDRAQRMLDARQFRTMQQLDVRYRGEPARTPSTTEAPADPRAIYAEVDGEAIRIIDPARSSVLWRRSFEFATREVTGDEMCYGPSDNGFKGVWWDPETRTLLIHQGYRTGGCMCDSGIIEHVRRIP